VTIRLEFFVHGVSCGQHASVKDAGDDDLSNVRSVKDYVFLVLDPTQARLDFVAGAAHERIAGEAVATCLKGIQVAVGLCQTPLAERVTIDFNQIGSGSKRETDNSQRH
jgi:hypothetical protein